MVTYMLKKSKVMYHKISKRFALAKTINLLAVEWQRQQEDQQKVCTMQAPSLTYCGKAKAARRSAGGLYYASTITDILWKAEAARGLAKRSALCKHHH